MNGPHIVVTLVSADGWYSAVFTLRAFANARRNLERLDILFVELHGALA